MNKTTVIALAVLIFLSGCGKTDEREELMQEKADEWIAEYSKKTEELDAVSDWELEFGIYDMDEDGIPELFAENGTRTYNVYTFKEGKVEIIGEIFLRPYITFEKDSIFTYGGAGTGFYSGYLYTLKDGSLSGKDMFSATYFEDKAHYFFADEDLKSKVEVGEEISETEYNEMLEKYKVKEFEWFRFDDINNKEKNIKDFLTVK